MALGWLDLIVSGLHPQLCHRGLIVSAPAILIVSGWCFGDAMPLSVSAASVPRWPTPNAAGPAPPPTRRPSTTTSTECAAALALGTEPNSVLPKKLGFQI